MNSDSVAKEKSAVDQAAWKLLRISELIKELEGLPVDYGLARVLTDVMERIDGSVDRPLVASAVEGGTKQPTVGCNCYKADRLRHLPDCPIYVTPTTDSMADLVVEDIRQRNWLTEPQLEYLYSIIGKVAPPVAVPPLVPTSSGTDESPTYRAQRTCVSVAAVPDSPIEPVGARYYLVRFNLPNPVIHYFTEDGEVDQDHGELLSDLMDAFVDAASASREEAVREWRDELGEKWAKSVRAACTRLEDKYERATKSPVVLSWEETQQILEALRSALAKVKETL